MCFSPPSFNASSSFKRSRFTEQHNRTLAWLMAVRYVWFSVRSPATPEPAHRANALRTCYYVYCVAFQCDEIISLAYRVECIPDLLHVIISRSARANLKSFIYRIQIDKISFAFASRHARDERDERVFPIDSRGDVRCAFFSYVLLVWKCCPVLIKLPLLQHPC